MPRASLMSLSLRFTVALLLVFVSACDRPRPTPVPGGVEGDAYLVMKSGDIKKAAGNEIFLIRDDSAFNADYNALCAALGSEYQRLRVAASQANDADEREMAARYKRLEETGTLTLVGKTYQKYLDTHHAVEKANSDAVSSVSAVLMRDTVASTRTDINAHYRFLGVKPGHYRLFGEKTIFDKEYQWWTKVEVVSDKVLRKDLDNSTEADKSVYCGIR